MIGSLFSYLTFSYLTIYLVWPDPVTFWDYIWNLLGLELSESLFLLLIPFISLTASSMYFALSFCFNFSPFSFTTSLNPNRGVHG